MQAINPEDEFDQAVDYITDLEEQKNGAFQKIVTKTTHKNSLYGLYKQSTIGDCNCRKPFIFGRAKWDSWNSHRGLSKPDAKIKYVDLVRQIRFSIEQEQRRA